MTTWLAHHGIKGQKWGVRNGPPYPLAPGDHSAAEKRHRTAPERIARNYVNTVTHPVKALKEIVRHPIKTSPEYQIVKYVTDDVKHLINKRKAGGSADNGAQKQIERIVKVSPKGWKNASSYANNINGRLEGFSKEDSDRIKERGTRIQDLASDMYDLAADEMEAAMKNPSFKEDLRKTLYEDFGRPENIDDKEFFDYLSGEYALYLAKDPKYSPKTHALVEKFDKEVNDYYDDCKQVANRLLGDIGNTPVSKKTTVTYSDVAYNKILNDTDASLLSWLGRHASETAFFDNSNINYDDFDSVLTFEDYKKYYSK